MTGKTWRAYLSTAATDSSPAVHARDRIGKGPWHNQRGDLIANNVEEVRPNFGFYLVFDHPY